MFIISMVPFVTKLKPHINKLVLDRTHKAYFPTTQTSSASKLVLLMSYLGNVNL
jgi:hypothetical protein